jgi:hypothetical protein
MIQDVEKGVQGNCEVSEENIEHENEDSEDDGDEKDHDNGDEYGVKNGEEVEDEDDDEDSDDDESDSSEFDSEPEVEDFDTSNPLGEEAMWLRWKEEGVTSTNSFFNLALERLQHRHVSTHLLIAAAHLSHHYVPCNVQYILQTLISHNNTAPIHSDVVMAVAEQGDGSKMIEVLLNHQPKLSITEEVLKKAAKFNYMSHNYTPVLEVILRRRSDVYINEKILNIAVHNETLGALLVATILKYRENIRVTTEVIISASTNRMLGDKLVTTLLAHGKHVSVDEDTIITVVGDFGQHPVGYSRELQHIYRSELQQMATEVFGRVIGLLLRRTKLDATDRILKAGIKNLTTGIGGVKALLAYRTHPVSEELMQEARATNMKTLGLLEVLQTFNQNTASTLHSDINVNLKEQSYTDEIPLSKTSTSKCSLCLELDIKNQKRSRLKQYLESGNAGCRYCLLIERCVEGATKQWGCKLDDDLNLDVYTSKFFKPSKSGSHQKGIGTISTSIGMRVSMRFRISRNINNLDQMPLCSQRSLYTHQT